MTMRLSGFLSTVVFAALAAKCPAQAPAPGGDASAASAAAAFSPFPNAIPAESVTREMLGKNIAIVGTIAKFDASTSERAPFRLTMIDRSTDPFVVVYWPDVAERIHGGAGMPHAGQKLSAEGTVTDYRGALQFRISNPRKIRLEGVGESSGASASMSAEPAEASDAAPAPAKQAAPKSAPAQGTSSPAPSGVLNVSEAVKHEAGKGNITVEGDVKSFKIPSSERAPQTLTLTDGTSEIDAIIFANGAKGFPEDLTKEGMKVRVTGQRGDYRGRAQIKLSRPTSITLPGGAAPAPEAGSEETASAGSESSPKPATHAAPANLNGVIHSADFTPELIGRTVTVAGKFERIIANEKGSYALLRDADGPLVIQLTPAVATAATASLTPGANVEVKGVVEFSKVRSQFVITPASAEDIKKAG